MAVAPYNVNVYEIVAGIAFACRHTRLQIGGVIGADYTLREERLALLEEQKPKKFFAFVDRWCGKLAGNAAVDMEPETATELVVSNVSVSCGSMKKLLLCGGAEKDTIGEIANALTKQLPAVDVICGGTLNSDPAVVRGLAECDAVVLVEQVDKSAMQTAMQLKNRAKTMEKAVVGIVVA